MKKKSTTLKIFVTLLFLLASASVKAQINTLADLGAGKAFCPAPTVSLTATSTGATANGYTWVRYDGKQGATPTGTATPITGQTSATMTDNPTGTGYYTYYSTSTNASGCISDLSDPTVIYVLPALSVAVTPPSTTAYCVGATPPTGMTLTANVTMTPTVTENLGLTYQWYKDGTAISTNGTSSTYTLGAADVATSAGTVNYTVKVSFAVPNTCTGATSANSPITINALPGKPTVVIN
jgi:hypothetical protein